MDGSIVLTFTVYMALGSVVRRVWSALQFPLDPLLANFLGTATVIYVLFLPLL